MRDFNTLAITANFIGVKLRSSLSTQDDLEDTTDDTKYIVVTPYQRCQAGEVTLREGDMVDVLQKSLSGLSLPCLVLKSIFMRCLFFANCDVIFFRHKMKHWKINCYYFLRFTKYISD